MISTTFAKGWFKGENGSNNYEYFPFFIRRISSIYEKKLYQRVIEAIKKNNSRGISEKEKKKLFSSAFDARLELLFLSGYFNYWSENDPNQKEVIRFFLDYLFTVNPSDPFGASGSYLPKSDKEIKQLVNLDGIKGRDINNLVGRLIINLKAAAWATTSETIYMAKSIEGPYFIGDLNKFAFIRSYFSLKNPYIWPHSNSYDFDRLDICTIYERNKSSFGKLDIDFYGNYSTDFKLNNPSKVIILVDGKLLKTIKEVTQITQYLKKITFKQMNKFRNLPVKEQMKKIMELHCKVYRNIFSFVGMDWRPTKEMYELIQKKEIKPKIIKDEVYEENGEYDEFTTLTLKMIDDANYDGKYSRFCEKLSNLSLNTPDGIEFYGGKAINLGILSKYDFNIPKGVVLTTEAFKHFMLKNNLYNKIKGLLNDLDVENIKKLNDVSSNIKKLILHGSFDETLGGIMKKSYNFDSKVSVRSSATTEDLKEASFAGQLDSFLNISKKNLTSSIKKCWASIFSPRAIQYRAKRGFSLHNVTMAVIIQEMIDSDVAGVSFTANPLSNKDDSLIIEAAEGLGKNVVSGLVNPDNITVSKNLQKVKYKANSDKKRLLSKKQIIELAKKSVDIEKIFGIPQDIEWAFYRGKLFILQARPISKFLQKEKTTNKKFGKIILKGVPVSEGIIKSKVCVIHDVSELEQFNEGNILVAKTTIPEFVVIMSKASGIITEYGGVSSHAAIVSRELGIPCIVGCKDLFKKLKNGDYVTMNGDTGVVYEGK